MWPFSRSKSQPKTNDYSDYVSVDRYLHTLSRSGLSADELEVAARALSPVRDQMLHPEIAMQMFGSLVAAELANYARRLTRDCPTDFHASLEAMTALEHAMQCYPHPALQRVIAEVLDAQGQPEAAAVARATALSLERTHKASDFDPILVTNLQ